MNAPRLQVELTSRSWTISCFTIKVKSSLKIFPGLIDINTFLPPPPRIGARSVLTGNF
jgi:hypothetical protein